MPTRQRTSVRSAVSSMSQQLATFQLRRSVQSANSNSHLQSREGRVRTLTIVRMVPDPGLIVIENTETLAATVATVALAGASVDVRVVLLYVVPLAEAEVAQTALSWIVHWIHGDLAMSTRAVATKIVTADATAMSQITIDTGRIHRRTIRQRRRWCRCRRWRRGRFRIATTWRCGSDSR